MNAGKMIRIWSAACSSGEEAYSLAILIDQMIPDVQQWNITILASDINLKSLQKLKEGIYGEWSFRENLDNIKKDYFTKCGKSSYEILPRLKQRVVPIYLNLVSDNYPSLLNNTNAMDIIFCRNVLMYFVPEKVNKTIESLSNSLASQGCLFVGASEHHLVQANNLETIIHEGHCFYQKKERIVEYTIPEFEWKDLRNDVKNSDKSSIKAESAETHSEPYNHTLISYDYIQELANQGKLQEALQKAEEAINQDKLNENLYYIRGLVNIELGNIQAGSQDLHKAIYLKHNFVLPYFILGNLARVEGNWTLAKKNYSIVLSLIKSSPLEEVIFGSNGLTVHRLKEVIESISDL